MKTPALRMFASVVLSLFSVAGMHLHAQSAGVVKRGDVWFKTDFEGPAALSGWHGGAKLSAGANGGQGIELSVPAGSKNAGITHSLPAVQVRGCFVRGSVRVRAQNVTAKPNPWNGIKCMLIIESPSGKQWPQAPLGTGSFDWQQASFVARIPADATNITVLLGLENVTGTVWFDDLKLTVVKAPVTPPAPAAGRMYKGHNLDRLRGAMISPGINAESLVTLGRDWKANLIRWQLIRAGKDASRGDDGYDEWLEDQLKKLDAALPVCEKEGIYVVVDLHSPPGGKATTGGYAGSDARLFTDPKSQEKLIRIWRHIASRYKHARPIWGYDLVNEPVEDDVAEDCSDWQELAERVARAIREIDPQRAIIVEPSSWGGPDGLNSLTPIPVSNVVYSAHMYIPHAFTHQNVHGKTPEYSYPGTIQGKYWDKEQLRIGLKPVIDFQKRYNVHMYIGEFSAIRWAPGDSAERYLRDVIEIMEENKWDWSYHAFREWDGWSVEHGPDPAKHQPEAIPTPRQKLLQEWFSKNQKPRW